jgi:predicted regulator of Ras-like GTPase activity (Roadblock/LC7/MglB family)
MFGFLKTFLRKAPAPPAQTQYAPEEEPAYESPAEAAYHPAPAPVQPPPSRMPLRKSVGQQNGRGIEVPLQNILNSLPLELQPRVRQPDVGQLTITVPLEKILAQLSRGVVRVSFGELRAAASEVFDPENDRDRVLVPLPLADILSQINPALITRRRVQRQVEVPPEISSPFENPSQGLFFSGPEKHHAEPAAPVRQVTPAAPPPAAAPRSPISPNPIQPMVAPSMPPIRHTMPSAPGPAPIPVSPAPTAPAPLPMPKFPIPTPPHAAPSPAPALRMPAAPKPMSAPAPAPVHQPQPIRPVPTPPPKPATEFFSKHAAPISPAAPVHAAAPAAAPAPAAPSLKPATNQECLAVSLTALAEAWPEPVRREIVDLGLVEAKVALPVSSIEQALRQGRIVFSWKTLRGWIKPAASPAPSAHDAAVLELPLKVVTPLFLTRKNEAAKPQGKVAVDEDIPNLFFGFPQPETGVPVAVATARPADTNFYVWDDSNEMVTAQESEPKPASSPGTKFVAKYATPNEVVSRAAGLEGVAGALIALPDGLMVANKLPPELNAETMAAFLPQIFGKVSQCTKELRMGDLNNLNFTVGNVPWKIFRVNAIFFAAFGRAGEPLPTAQLAALAAELDHKPK